MLIPGSIRTLPEIEQTRCSRHTGWVKIAQISDAHLDLQDPFPHEVDVWDNFRWALESARANEVDLIVVSGDLALLEGKTDLYEAIAALMRRGNTPYLLIPGNHDDRRLFAGAFGRRYAQLSEETLDLSVRIAGASMYLLDSGDARLTSRQLAWLDMQIRAHREAAIRGELSRRVILWIHHPIITGFHRYMDQNYRLHNAEDVEGLLTPYGGDLDIAVFCGHYHTEDARESSGITQYVCPSLYVQIDPKEETFRVLSSAPGYRLVDVGDTGALATEVVYREEFPKRPISAILTQ